VAEDPPPPDDDATGEPAGDPRRQTAGIDARRPGPTTTVPATGLLQRLRHGAPDPTLANPRLDAYVARTQKPLDLLALLTMWFTLVPVGSVAGTVIPGWLLLLARILLSGIFVTDFVIRARRSAHPWRYTRAHPLGLIAAVLPPARVLFSLRLVGTLFRRGALVHFVLAALLLVMNLALIVFFYERDASGANITSLGEALWWAVVTVTTVGYGDEYPITGPGQIAASCLMVLGVTTLAVVTANISSTFLAQGQRPASGDGTAGETGVGHAEPVSDDAARFCELADRLDRLETAVNARLDSGDTALHQRLDRLEELLVAAEGAPPAGRSDP
jgi:voltage-gated potassium channel